MAEVIPAVIEDSWEGVHEKISQLEGKTEWVHLDASDGVFTDHKTWNSPGDLNGLSTGLLFEVHLMIQIPEKLIDDWFQGPVKRIIVHYEAFKDKEKITQVVEKIKKSGREAVLAINPGTAQLAVEPFLSSVDGVLVMGVDPGWSGAEFKPETEEKIKALREKWPNGIIGVDGGVNAERAPGLVRAGADRVVSSSFVWSFGDPAEGIGKIKESIK